MISDTVKVLVCLHVGSGISRSDGFISRLELWLQIFKRRFSAKVIIGVAGLETLSAAKMADWIGSDLLEQAVCVEHEDFIQRELLSAAGKNQSGAILLLDAQTICNGMPEALRFILESLANPGDIRLSVDGNHLSVPVDKLDTMLSQATDGAWSVRLAALFHRTADGCVQSPQAMSVSDTQERADTSVSGVGLRHCFATLVGVDRVGGIDRFRALPLIIGGMPVSRFDRYWLLVADGVDGVNGLRQSADSGLRVTTAVRAIWTVGESAAPVVFDLCPASQEGNADAADPFSSSISVPRQVVVARRCHALKGSTNADSAQQAVFVMSNFNKGRYVHSSLYSLLMQSHRSVAVEVVDDISTDDSEGRIKQFCELLCVPQSFVSLRKNASSRGTYWIRNEVTHRRLSHECVFFVNDSDDYSSALRASLQLSALAQNAEALGCFFNIVRVNAAYQPLFMNGEVERYGTASLCYTPRLIKRVGYFQNIRKNADTEFIERVKRFEGGQALPWYRYPVLFQTFDGGNLTADIYEVEKLGTAIKTKASKRDMHVTIFRNHHARLSRESLASQFDFPPAALPDDYAPLGDEFLVPVIPLAPA